MRLIDFRTICCVEIEWMKFVRMISKVECGQKSTRLGSSSSSFQQTHCIVVCPVDRGSSLQSPPQQKSRSRPRRRQVLLLPNTRKWGLFFCCCAEATQVICPMKWLLLLPAGLLWHQRDHLLMDKGGNWFLSSSRHIPKCRLPGHTTTHCVRGDLYLWSQKKIIDFQSCQAKSIKKTKESYLLGQIKKGKMKVFSLLL